MKILLREYGDEIYVWKTAKYDNDHFLVGEVKINETNIVSIINDNRKKYMKCSSCGKVFRKGDKKFETHKKESATPMACLNCMHLTSNNEEIIKQHYVFNKDGTVTEKMERSVKLVCGAFSYWSCDDVNSEKVLTQCKKRQCKNAELEEINDTFMEYPGIFDDIITVDTLLDKGYEVPYVISGVEECYLGGSQDVYAIINELGIIDRFLVVFNDDYFDVYYSKRYDELFVRGHGGKYIVWNHTRMDDKTRREIKEDIAILYR